jgi:hypothetical protein
MLYSICQDKYRKRIVLDSISGSVYWSHRLFRHRLLNHRPKASDHTASRAVSTIISVGRANGWSAATANRRKCR